MATLPTTKRISREDIKEAPEWIEKLLNPVNTFFDAIYNAVNGDLTFTENMSAIVKEVQFTTLPTYSSGDWYEIFFPNTLRKKATGCWIIGLVQDEDNYTAVVQPVSLDWTELSGNIIIEFVSGLEDSTTYNLKLMVI